MNELEFIAKLENILSKDQEILDNKIPVDRATYLLNGIRDLKNKVETQFNKAERQSELENIEDHLNVDVIRSAFENTYNKTFGRLLNNIGMRVLNLRVTVIGRRPKFDLSILGPSGNSTIEEAKIDNLINVLQKTLKHPFSVSIGDNLKNMKFEHF